MIIRDMIEGDIPELAALYEQFWGDKSDTDKMRAQFRKLSGKGTHIFLSAVEGDRLLGSVMGVVCEELYGDCRPFLVLENMIVDKNARRGGTGRELMGELEQRAKAAGCTQIILVTEIGRSDACAFYEAMGFPAGKNSGYKKKLD